MATTVDASFLLANLVNYQYNPSLMQRAVIAMLDNVIVDPTNPFVFLMEAGCVLTAGAMEQNAVLTRKQYPFSAQTPEDLYLHMSDADYVNRFAIPGKTVFQLLLPKDEVLAKMVTDSATGIRKVVLPRNTTFTVADVDFSIQYPVEIQQLAHGGLQVIYDVDKTSPLQTLTTNVIPFEIRTTSTGDWIWFALDVQQFDILSQSAPISTAADFSSVTTLTDEFYYARVFYQNTSGAYVEMATTHTPDIYDPAVPTAVIRVVDSVVTITVPQVYVTTGMISSKVRCDVYQTKGPINMILSEYPSESFSAKWQAFDPADNTQFTAPMVTLQGGMIYSDRTVADGSDAVPFATLRQQVIQNSVGAEVIPITNVQIESVLTSNGYSVVKNIDNVTNRVFLATRTMPQPADASLITAAAASIQTITLKLSDATQLAGVIDNGDRVTVTPSQLYKIVSGVTQMVSDSEVTAILALPAEKRALAVTSGSYLYTPFHYVFDTSNSEFAARPYYLDDPIIETKVFVSENDTTLIQVATDVYSVLRSANGYVLHVTCVSADAWKTLPDNQCFAQLAYIPAGEKERAYLNGTQVGFTDAGERIFEFDLSTNFDIDDNDNITLTKFKMFVDQAKLTAAALTTMFDIVYSTNTVLGSQWHTESVDQVVGSFLLPAGTVGITHEQLRVRFGFSLSTLWARARSVVSSVTFQTYAQDVPLLYTEDVLQRDANGRAVLINGSNQPIFNYLHRKGDAVLDAHQQPVMQHRAGDVVLDAITGDPVVVNPRGMLRQIDLMLIEGAYWFATDNTATAYKALLTETLVSWLTNDLASMTDNLLEQTRIYFYPKTTMGSIQVMIADGKKTSIAAGQAFVVTLYVSKVVYEDDDLREKLRTTTISTINAQLANTTVSNDGMTTALRDVYGNDVISVQFSGLGGAAALPALTILDEANRLSIRKRLVAQADNTLYAEEDVTVNFVQHELVV